MAAVLDTVSNAATDFMSVRGVCDYAGITKTSVFHAINKGRLHPLRPDGSPRYLFFRGEVLAWRHRYQWRPSSEELAALVAYGYKAEDFTPATPGEPTTPLGVPGGSSRADHLAPTGGAANTSGASGASGALISPADVLAYVQGLSQSLTAGMSGIGGEVAERSMRPFAEMMRAGVPVDIASVTGMAGEVAERAMRPFAETIRESIAPLSASMAEASRAPQTPQGLPASAVERQLNAQRVELAYMLNRGLESMRPIVERLTASGQVTPEDTAPYLAFISEAAESLIGTPFYELARQAQAMIPGMIENAARIVNQAPPTPIPDTPDTGKE